MLHHVAKKIWDKAEVSDSGKEGLLTKLPKSGNLESVISTEVSCYCLFLGKLISRILLDRMKTAVDPADRVP